MCLIDIIYTTDAFKRCPARNQYITHRGVQAVLFTPYASHCAARCRALRHDFTLQFHIAKPDTLIYTTIMNSSETIRIKLAAYKPVLAEKYNVSEIGIFGSYVRGEQKQKSDLDLLVVFAKSISLLEFIHLENELSALLGVKVDLVMKTALKPRIGKHILEEVVPV